MKGEVLLGKLGKPDDSLLLRDASVKPFISFFVKVECLGVFRLYFR